MDAKDSKSNNEASYLSESESEDGDLSESEESANATFELEERGGSPTFLTLSEFSNALYKDSPLSSLDSRVSQDTQTQETTKEEGKKTLSKLKPKKTKKASALKETKTLFGGEETPVAPSVADPLYVRKLV